VRIAPGIVELTVRAPMAARKFEPGQFFRVQTFESGAPVIDGTRLQTEPLALYGSKVDAEAGTASVVVMENGASSRLIATLKPGDPITFMGPTGVRATVTEGGQTILYVGGMLGAAQIRAVGPALRAAGNKVLYVACFDNAAEEVPWQDELEAAADAILWVVKDGAPIAPRRPQDRSVQADVLDAMVRYAGGKLGDPAPIRLQDVDRMVVVGSSCLVRRIRDARAKELAPYLAKKPHTTASISTPMQCMLKGVCSQCLQWQLDPATGKRTKAVFGCSWQDQPLDIVDLDNLDERLSQNKVQERLTNLWLDHLFEKGKVARI
jgi:NAD(P)H-flavin reductase